MKIVILLLSGINFGSFSAANEYPVLDPFIKADCMREGIRRATVGDPIVAAESSPFSTKSTAGGKVAILIRLCFEVEEIYSDHRTNSGLSEEFFRGVQNENQDSHD